MPSWTVFSFLIGVWFLGMLLGGMTTQTTVGAEEETVIETLMTWNIVDIKWRTIIPVPTLRPEWQDAVWTVMTWNYPIFDGQFVQYIKMFFLALTAGVAVVVGWAFAQLIRGSG